LRRDRRYEPAVRGLNRGMGWAGRSIGTAPTDCAARHCYCTDNDDGADDQPYRAGSPDQERSGNHVLNQARMRDVALRADLVLEVEKLIAVPLANLSRVQLEQGAH
jgi:hypothetical protein